MTTPEQKTLWPNDDKTHWPEPICLHTEHELFTVIHSKGKWYTIPLWIYDTASKLVGLEIGPNPIIYEIMLALAETRMRGAREAVEEFTASRCPYCHGKNGVHTNTELPKDNKGFPSQAFVNCPRALMGEPGRH